MVVKRRVKGEQLERSGGAPDTFWLDLQSSVFLLQQKSPSPHAAEQPRHNTVLAAGAPPLHRLSHLLGFNEKEVRGQTIQIDSPTTATCLCQLDLPLDVSGRWRQAANTKRLIMVFYHNKGPFHRPFKAATIFLTP